MRTVKDPKSLKATGIIANNVNVVDERGYVSASPTSLHVRSVSNFSDVQAHAASSSFGQRRHHDAPENDRTSRPLIALVAIALQFSILCLPIHDLNNKR